MFPLTRHHLCPLLSIGYVYAMKTSVLTLGLETKASSQGLKANGSIGAFKSSGLCH